MSIVLKTPIREEDIASLRIGDVVYLDGILATCRDSGHSRLVQEGIRPSLDLEGGAIFHAGPIVRSKPNGNYEIVSVGPTTSMRMEQTEADFLRLTGIKLLIGKGGMGDKTVEACQKYKAIHTVIPGGCAVTEAAMVEEVLGVEWLDLGMPEAFWIARVRHFGPLVVSIDTQGGNLFRDRRQEIDANRQTVAQQIKPLVHYMK